MKSVRKENKTERGLNILKNCKSCKHQNITQVLKSKEYKHWRFCHKHKRYLENYKPCKEYEEEENRQNADKRI